MTRHSLHALCVAGMVLLAGCAGGLSGSPSAGDGGNAGDGAVAGTTGTVNFYVSDEPNAIDDFAHLNVTITAVGFQQAGDGDGEMDENETESPENETEAPDEETDTPENETESPENETEAPEEDMESDESDDDADESGGWVEFDVDDRTVDLTELRGANSSLVDQFDVPEGSYNKVFVHVNEVDATLENGESVDVKLPSEKLQINEKFQVENGSEIDFVFDISVHKAGNSGKYILKPVISESGTDVPIDDVGERDRDDSEERNGEDELNATFVGDVTQGENATVAVTSGGEPVANASVLVNDERVGATNADGQATFAVPESEELEVIVRSGDAEAELEREFDSDDGAGAGYAIGDAVGA